MGKSMKEVSFQEVRHQTPSTHPQKKDKKKNQIFHGHFPRESKSSSETLNKGMMLIPQLFHPVDKATEARRPALKLSKLTARRTESAS